MSITVQATLSPVKYAGGPNMSILFFIEYDNVAVARIVCVDGRWPGHIC